MVQVVFGGRSRQPNAHASTHTPTIDDGKRSVAATADTTWSTEKAGRRSAGLGALRFVATKEIDAGVATSGG